MSEIGIVPIRSGSKRISDKNIKNFLGKPLFWWVCSALENAERVDYFVVSSDSQEYLDLVASFGFRKVKLHKRFANTADDKATTESVMEEVVQRYEIRYEDNILLTQVTSPWMLSRDFNDIIDMFNYTTYKSVLSVARLDKFLWNEKGESVNYDYVNRPRSQEMKDTKYYIENGGAYIISAYYFEKAGCRLSPEVGLYKMPFWTSIEIDTEEDWTILECIMKGYKEWN